MLFIAFDSIYIFSFSFTIDCTLIDMSGTLFTYSSPPNSSPPNSFAGFVEVILFLKSKMLFVARLFCQARFWTGFRVCFVRIHISSFTCAGRC